jgi:hypothetical protein
MVVTIQELCPLKIGKSTEFIEKMVNQSKIWKGVFFKACYVVHVNQSVAYNEVLLQNRGWVWVCGV